MVLLISLVVAVATAVAVIRDCKAAHGNNVWEEAPSRSAQTRRGHVFSVRQPKWALHWLAFAAPFKEICLGVNSNLPTFSYTPSLCKYKPRRGNKNCPPKICVV